MVIIYTFGLKVTYKGEDRSKALKQFIEQHQVNIVLDVRYNNGNYYKNWNCNGEHIESMVKSCFNGHVRYIHDPRLGIPPEIRKTYDPGWAEFWYENQLYRWNLTSFFEKCADSERIVLLCVENLRDPKTPYCHRIWLRDYLVEQGIAQLGEVVE